MSDPSRPEVGNQYDRLKRLKGFRDIDNTIESMIKFFKSEYMPDLPHDIKSDKTKLLKFMKEIYTLRGTADGFNILFRTIFGESAHIYLPKDYKLFSSSSSEWKVDSVIRVQVPDGLDTTTSSDILLAKGYYAIGETSGVKIAVGDVINDVYVGNTLVIELYVDKDTLTVVDANNKPLTLEKYNEFIYNENLGFVDSEGFVVNNSLGNPLRAKIISSITGIDITNEGSNYRISDDITFGGTNDGTIAEINTLSPGSVEEILIDNPGTGYSSSEIVFVSRYFELYGDLSYNGTDFQGFISGSKMVGDDSGATAMIRLRDGKRIYVDNITGTFTTDEISKTDYGSEIVRTSGHVDTFTVAAATGWADGTYYDLFQTGTDKDGTGLILTLVVSSESATATIVNSGSGYIATEVVTFTEPGDTNTVAITIDGVKEYTARLDRLVEIGSVDGGGTATTTYSDSDPRYNVIDSWSLDDSGSGYIEAPPAYALNDNGVSTASISTFGGHIGGVQSVKIDKYGLADETTTVQFRDTAEKDVYVAVNTIEYTLGLTNISGVFEADHIVFQGSTFATATFIGKVKSWSSPDLVVTAQLGTPELTLDIKEEDNPTTIKGEVDTSALTGNLGVKVEFTLDNFRVGDEIYQGGSFGSADATGLVVATNIKEVSGIPQYNVVKIVNSTGVWSAAAVVKNTRVGAIPSHVSVKTVQTGAVAKFTTSYDVTGNDWVSNQSDVTAVLTSATGSAFTVKYSTSGGNYRLYFDQSTLNGTFTVGNSIWRGVQWSNKVEAWGIITDVSEQSDATNPYIVIDERREAGTVWTPQSYGTFLKGSQATLVLTGASTPSDLTGTITGQTSNATATIVEKTNDFTYTISGVTNGPFDANEAVTDAEGTPNSGTVDRFADSNIHESIPTGDKIDFQAGAGNLGSDLVGLNNSNLVASISNGNLLSAWFDNSGAGYTHNAQTHTSDTSTTNGTGATFNIAVAAGGEELTFTPVTEAVDPGGAKQAFTATGYAVGDILIFKDPYVGGSEYNAARFTVTDIDSGNTISIERCTPIDNDNFITSDTDATSLSITAGSSEADMGSSFLVTDTPTLTDVGIGNQGETQNIKLLKVVNNGIHVPDGNVNEQATGTVQFGAIVDKMGVHKTKSSHLNEISRVSDGVEYQTWSYGIQTSVNPIEWLDISKNLFHPAGTTVIPVFTLDEQKTSTVSTSTIVELDPP